MKKSPDDNSAKPLEDKVRDWLLKQGYPFEMQVAAAAMEGGFTVEQGVYYTDEVTQKAREIDVVGQTTGYLENNRSVRLHLVIECKYARAKPWVLLTPHISIRREIVGAWSWRVPTNDRGRLLLSNMKYGEAEQNAFLHGPGTSPYSAVTAL